MEVVNTQKGMRCKHDEISLQAHGLRLQVHDQPVDKAYPSVRNWFGACARSLRHHPLSFAAASTLSWDVPASAPPPDTRVNGRRIRGAWLGAHADNQWSMGHAGDAGKLTTRAPEQAWQRLKGQRNTSKLACDERTGRPLATHDAMYRPLFLACACSH